MSCCKTWIVIGMLVIVTISIVLATSDPGYSKYYRSYANHKTGYSRYGTPVSNKPYHDPYYRSLGEAYRSLPTRRGKTYQHAHSPYRGYQNRAYYNEHLKYSRGSINPHFGYHAKHNSYRQPINRPKPYPIPHPEPHPIPHPEPYPIPHPEPHPMPHPHPNPAPHPITQITLPQPVPHPQPIPLPHPHPQPILQPNPSPAPMPHPQPHPVPAPTPIPFPPPTPQPHPQEVPDVIVEEPSPIPDFVDPSPISVKPDIEIFPEEPRPVRPIETIGRPPVAPSIKPPTFFELQRSVPGFVDVQRVKIHPQKPDIETFPEEPRPVLPIETIGRPPVAPSIKPPTLFELQRSVPGFVDVQRVNIHPHGEPIIQQLTPEQQLNILQFPIQNTITADEPKFVEIESEPTQDFDLNSFEPLLPVEKVVVQPHSNTRTTPLRSTTSIVQPLFEAQLENAQPIPIQNAVNIPLLAKAVPAVPESNPQPLFRNVTPATAQATALLLQASRAEFAGVSESIPAQAPRNAPILPVQQIPSVAPQIDFRRFPSVVLPDPVPAVPLTQP